MNPRILRFIPIHNVLLLLAFWGLLIVVINSLDHLGALPSYSDRLAVYGAYSEMYGPVKAKALMRKLDADMTGQKENEKRRRWHAKRQQVEVVFNLVKANEITVGKQRP